VPLETELKRFSWSRFPWDCFPWISLALAALCTAAALVPAAALEYDRLRVGEGEAWRLLTGQIVHWTARMAAFDLVMLLGLGVWLEIRGDRRLAAVALALGGGLTALAVHAFSPDLLVYRGSSGAASALFVLAAVRVAASSDPWPRVLALAAVALFLAKAVFEQFYGQTLFAGPLPQGVRVVPLVHLLGGLGGLASSPSPLQDDAGRNSQGKKRSPAEADDGGGLTCNRDLVP
jgi:rhomboid family GlyGly-CTERM serine protease